MFTFLRALCQEKLNEWSIKFQPLGLVVGQLTGDQADVPFEEIASYDVITTTPEKWDAMTRRWNASSFSMELMDSICLLMVDEIHLLNESRGKEKCKINVPKTVQNNNILHALMMNQH